MRVYEYIMKIISERKAHFTLIDPNKQEPEEAASKAKIAEECGTDAIMVGGSTGLTKTLVDRTIECIKRDVSVPVIIFPSGSAFLSDKADAILFMSFLNSSLRKYIIEEQVEGAILVKKYGLEPIAVGYIVVEPGMTVGKVGEAILLKRDDHITAIKYCLAAQYLGMKMVYLEAGSGAPQPVPPELIIAVKKEISIPLIVGGGIRSGRQAEEIARAGADIIVTGTIVEESSSLRDKLREIISSLRNA